MLDDLEIESPEHINKEEVKAALSVIKEQMKNGQTIGHSEKPKMVFNINLETGEVERT